MSSQRYAPPEFLRESINYTEYKRKFLQEQINETLGNKIIKEEDCMEKLITYYDFVYTKVYMMDACKKYKKAVGVERKKINLLMNLLQKRKRTC